MFTVNFKGKPNPKDKRLVKIEMILFRSGYTRVQKVLQITGIYKSWNQKTQNFNPRSSEAIDKNKYLFDLKMKYLKIAEDWENDGRNWSPIQWSHCFEVEKAQKEESRIMNVSQMIDFLIEKFRNTKKIKNGQIVTSTSNSKQYYFLKRNLSDFTKEKYGKSLSSYYFEDITDTFLLDYLFFLQKRGLERGNKGAVVTRLRRLRAVCTHAEKIGMYGVNFAAFEAVHQHMRWGKFVPKTISPDIITAIENLDKKDFTPLEVFHIDMFLFSFYVGGMANVDVAYLTWDCIQGDLVVYERMKFPKEAKVPLMEKPKDIISKYKHKCYSDFVLPIFTHKHKEEWQQRARLKRLSERVNKTLRKVAQKIKYNEKITWYTARGTYITKMINDGYHPILVAEHAGNSPGMIYKHYYKTIDRDKILQQMNKSF